VDPRLKPCGGPPRGDDESENYCFDEGVDIQISPVSIYEMGSSQAAIPGVVLAAGRSARYGADNKLLLDLGGSAVIKHSLDAMLNSKAEPVYFVTGHQRELIISAIDELKDHPKLNIIDNPEWESGRASSLRLAVQSISDEAHGVVITLGDMPLMTSELIDRLIDSFLETHKLTFAVLKGKKGHPIIWPREHWNELTEISGDKTAFNLVQMLWDETERVVLSADEDCTQLDMDTPDDFERIKAAWETQQ